MPQAKPHVPTKANFTLQYLTVSSKNNGKKKILGHNLGKVIMTEAIARNICFDPMLQLQPFFQT